MESLYKNEDKRLIFKINEDIDECYTQKMRRKLDNEIEKYMPKEIIFDFNNVSFMDSAGIGLLIGRYKLANIIGANVKVANINTPIRKIFEMSGILRIMPEVKNKNESQMQKKEPTLNYLGQKKEPTLNYLGQKKDRHQITQEEKKEPTLNYKEVQYE